MDIITLEICILSDIDTTAIEIIETYFNNRETRFKDNNYLLEATRSRKTDLLNNKIVMFSNLGLLEVNMLLELLNNNVDIRARQHIIIPSGETVIKEYPTKDSLKGYLLKNRDRC